MDGESLLAFVRFHAWANDRILTTTAGLKDEEFRRPGVLDHDSAFGTLRHLVDVDWSWREFCIGNDVGDAYVWDHGFVLDDLPAIHAFCIEEDMRLRSFVESLDDAALNEPYGTRPDFTRPRWIGGEGNHLMAPDAFWSWWWRSRSRRRRCSLSWRSGTRPPRHPSVRDRHPCRL